MKRIRMMYLCIGLLARLSVNPKSIFAAQRGSKLEVPGVCISAETLPSCFSSHTVNKYLLRGLFGTSFCIVVLFSDDFTV